MRLGEIAFNDDQFAAVGAKRELFCGGVIRIAVTVLGLRVGRELDHQHALAGLGLDQCPRLQNLDLGIVLLTDGCPQSAIFLLCIGVVYLGTENDPIALHDDSPFAALSKFLLADASKVWPARGFHWTPERAGMPGLSC